MRWRLIKSDFSRQYKKRKTSETNPEHHTEKLWQARFWEHYIRDEKDFINHVEYIHYNPVKHGLVKSPIDWTHSSFHKYVRNGTYDRDWGAEGEIKFAESPEEKARTRALKTMAGIWSPIHSLMEDNPDLTEEEAIVEYEKILKWNKLGKPKNPFEEEDKEEEKGGEE